MTIPNLDCDASLDLMAFWQRYQAGRNYLELIPQGGKGSKRAVANLANYASNLHTARTCRLRGEIGTAQMYESICERIYKNLPERFRW